MDLKPPEGSKISIANDRGGLVVVVPPPGGLARYFVGLFILVWLGFWMVGFTGAGSALLSGKTPLLPTIFIGFWLCLWTLGGVFAVGILYRSFRTPVPETFELRRNGVIYDSGIAPPQFNTFRRNRSPRDAWRSAFPKRVCVELDRSQMQSLRLRETDTGNRLTFDIGPERIEIAPTAGEVEREWLARLLARRYCLPQILGANPSQTGS